MFDDKFSPSIVLELIPELIDNEDQLNEFIIFFKKFFASEDIFVKFVNEHNKYYLRVLIIEYYEFFKDK
jgi:hypothetical protein